MVRRDVVIFLRRKLVALVEVTTKLKEIEF